MPTSTALKSAVTRCPTAEPVDQLERQRQAEHHEAVENAATTEQEGPTVAPEPAPAQDLEPAPEPEGSLALEAEAESTPSRERSGKQLKRGDRREAHAVQSAFLAGNLGKPITVFTLNGVRLVGRLQQFDQYCLLLEVPAPMLVFKHAISTIAPAR